MLGKNIDSKKISFKMYDESKGNPFFLIEIMKVLVDEDIISYREGSWDIDFDTLNRYEIPNTPEEVFKKRLNSLPEGETEFLELVSSFEGTSPLKILKKMEFSQRERLFDMLDDLTTKEILVQEKTPQDITCAFNHVIMKDVVYRDIEESKRKILHTKTGNVLEEEHKDSLEENSEALAYQFLRSDDKEKAAKLAKLLREEAKAV